MEVLIGLAIGAISGWLLHRWRNEKYRERWQEALDPLEAQSGPPLLEAPENGDSDLTETELLVLPAEPNGKARRLVIRRAAHARIDLRGRTDQEVTIEDSVGCDIRY